ncbi:HAD family hydrolase [Anaerosporobacter sp.]|uniref:HAD family hydrolase n=1 Tax=Anaerosporobacter sp. TaxID=1872529 RepID=UPI00286EB63D|nr:HAD family hydrolase [Anaerosporobacter sp.]
MEKRIIFFDIDGTLVNMEGKIADSTKEALLLAKANGHRLVICTGRSRFQIFDELLELGFEGIVGGAGAYVVCGDKEIYHHYIEMEKRKPLFDYLEKGKFAYAVQCDCGTVFNKRCKVALEEEFEQLGINKKQMEYMFGEIMIREDVWNYPNEEKIIFHRAPYTIEKIKADLQSDFEVTAFSLNIDHSGAGEIGAANINKATGMQIYLDHIGAKREDTIAIGDGPNDSEMIEFAGIGVVMGNAHQQLKDMADLVTTSIDEDGIYNAMKQIGVI